MAIHPKDKELLEDLNLLEGIPSFGINVGKGSHVPYEDLGDGYYLDDDPTNDGYEGWDVTKPVSKPGWTAYNVDSLDYNSPPGQRLVKGLKKERIEFFYDKSNGKVPQAVIDRLLDRFS